MYDKLFYKISEFSFMERKMENTNLSEEETKLRKEAEEDFYWGNLHLARFLYEQGKINEAEEIYSQISGEDDTAGDANAEYCMLLLEQGRDLEAVEYYFNVLKNSDTAPREMLTVYVATMLTEENLNRPFWVETTLPTLNDILATLSYCVGVDVTLYIESILIYRTNSKDAEIRKWAKCWLFNLYISGSYDIEGDRYYSPLSPIDSDDFKSIDKLCEMIDFIPTFEIEWLDRCSAFDHLPDNFDNKDIMKFIRAFAKYDPEKIDLHTYDKQDFFSGFYSDISDYLEKNGENIGFIPNGLDFIPCYTFQNCEEIECMVIPEGIKEIGGSVFKNCINLREISLPSTLESLWHSAFENCTSLKSIVIPKNVKEIEEPFIGCSSLETVYFECEQEDICLDYFGIGDEVEIVWGYKG